MCSSDLFPSHDSTGEPGLDQINQGLVVGAYSRNRYNTERSKANAISDFQAEAFAKCMGLPE